MEGAYDPKPSVIVQGFKFNSRIRESDETVSTYVAALRNIAEQCSFTDVSEMLCDHLVCGINHPGIQKRLLAEKDLSFTSALDIARALEAAEKGTHALKPHSSSAIDHDSNKTSVHKQFLMSSKVSPRSQRLSNSQDNCRNSQNKKSNYTGNQSKSKSCYRCGGDHLPSTCKCKDWECRVCKKKGHIARVCR